MAEFNAMDTAAFKGVWVFCEQREGEIQSISYQLLSEGRKLANDLGVELAGVVMGSGLAEADLKTLGGYGADRVYNIDSPLLKDYTTDGYAKALCDLIMDKKPEIMLIGATNLGRDLGPRCAARLHTGLTADCTHLDVDVEKYKNFLRTTSNIDVESENDIMREIHELAKSKTVILVSHRLANVVGADHIYVLDHGIVAESGSHEELLAHHGLYERLWSAQQTLEQFGKECAGV